MANPIGIFGSIFDPVHNGHLATVQLAAEFFELDTIVYIPAGIPPHKQLTVTASVEDRLAMLTTALHGDKRAHIWKNELYRTEISYTVDTLDEIAAVYPQAQLYFIIGSDNLHEIHTWHRYADILKKVVLCVTHRPGYPVEIPSILNNAKLEIFPSPLWGLSSSRIRQLLSQGHSGKYLLPDQVCEYIIENGLYLLSCE